MHAALYLDVVYLLLSTRNKPDATHYAAQQ
jgi:hypothetical protein